MPRIRNCSHLGCHTKVAMRTQYCSAHQKLHRQNQRAVQQYNKIYNKDQRDKSANDFYQSTQWDKMRTFVYSRDMGLDQITGDPIIGRSIIDHLHPLSVVPDERLDSDNLWLLSTESHNVKTMIENQLLASPNGRNKAKHVTKEWYQKRVLGYIAKRKK